MTYEIPQSVQYKERIAFGLTFKQLGVALSFGLIGLLMYQRVSGSQELRLIIASIPVILGALFMYADLWNRIVAFYQWFILRETRLGDNKMKQFIKLGKVEDGHYHVCNKKGVQRVAALLVEPLNFKIKPVQDKESIIHSFQKLLNAIDFPIQFCMYTDDLNLDKYLGQLEYRVQNKGNNTQQQLFDAHKKYLQAIMKERLAVNRRFLIVVPENEMGIDAQLQIITDLVQSMNLKCSVLRPRTLINVLIKFFNNPRGRKELLEKEHSLYNIIAPETVINKSDHIKINETYNRVMTAVGYPRRVEEGFLDRIITTMGNFDLSIHVEPIPLESTMVMLNREIQKQRADLYAAELKHSFHPSLEIQYQDTKGVLDSIQKGEEKLFNVSLYLNVKAKSIKELDILTRKVQSQLNSLLIVPKVPKFRMAQGIRSMLPFGINELAVKRNITTFALSAFFPFTSPFLILEKGGVFLGLNKNKLPIIKDIFNLANANGTILATSGSGKSYAAKLIISRYLMNGTKVIVIDPQSEYTKLAEKYGGKIITISRTSDTIINPLDLLGHNYTDKRLALMDMFRVMFGEISEIQKAILDRALSKTYNKRGIGEFSYKDKAPPVLKDLYEELERMSNEGSVYEKTTYVALLNRLRMYVDGVFSFLNNQTKLEVNNNFVVFNIGNMPKQVKPVMMFLILDYVYSMMKQDRERKLLVVDEAWSLLQNAGEEGYVFEVVKTCRKWNLGMLLITQDVADLLNSHAGRAVLANTSYTILLRQKPAVIDSVKDVFHLSFAEREHLLTANVGEGLLMMENDHQELRIIASPEEHNLITTNADELIAAQANIPPETSVAKRKVLIELDLTKGFYKKSVLSPEEIDYLLNNGYVESRHVPMDNRNYAIYLVKKVGWHTPEHTFLLHSAVQETRRYTSKVWSDETARTDNINPDLIFEKLNGERWAIEVETGSSLRHHPDYLKKKTAKLNALYGTCWRWLLTSTDNRREYERRYGVPVLLRHNFPHFIKYHFGASRQEDNGATNCPPKTTVDKPEAEGQFQNRQGSSKQGVQA